MSMDYVDLEEIRAIKELLRKIYKEISLMNETINEIKKQLK